MAFDQSPAFKHGNEQMLLDSHEGQPKDSRYVALSLVKIWIFSGVCGKLWLGWSQQYSERSLLTKPSSRIL